MLKITDLEMEYNKVTICTLHSVGTSVAVFRAMVLTIRSPVSRFTFVATALIDATQARIWTFKADFIVVVSFYTSTGTLSSFFITQLILTPMWAWHLAVSSIITRIACTAYIAIKAVRTMVWTGNT